MRVYYFGYDASCPGHTLRQPDFVNDWTFYHTNPWGHKLDGGLCPKTTEYQAQGHALLHHKDGWTAIAFWDRSGDSRGASNSAFLMEGTHTFDEMLKLGLEHFPTVFRRFGFPIINVTPSAPTGKEAS